MQSKTSYFESGKFNVTLNLVVVHCIAALLDVCIITSFHR